MLNKCHYFSWTVVVESAFHQQIKIRNTLHCRYFMQFQNLSEENRSRAAWNFIEWCFLTVLSNERKHLLIPGWIIFLFSEIITLSILHYLTVWQQTFTSQWTEIWYYILWNWRRDSLSYRNNIRVWNMKSLPCWSLGKNMGPKKPFCPIRFELSEGCAVECAKDSLWVSEQYTSEKLSYITCSYKNRTISELVQVQYM